MKNVKNIIKKLFGGVLVCLCLVSFANAKCAIPEDIEDMYDEAKEVIKNTKYANGIKSSWEVREYNELIEKYWGDYICGDGSEELYREAFEKKLGKHTRSTNKEKMKEVYLNNPLMWERKIQIETDI